MSERATGGDVLRRRGDPVDEDGGVGLTRLEATDTDGSVEARVLDDVDAAVVLQEVGQAREARALDGLGADDLDLAGHLLQGKDGARNHRRGPRQCLRYGGYP